MRAMKDSGVPWLKEIPVNWKVERGKNVLALQKRPVRDNDEVVTCFRDGEVILRSLRRTEGFTMSDKEIGYQGINEGDIVIHGMDGFAGAMGVSKSTGKGSPVLIVCTPKYDAIPQYIIYYLRALAMTDVFVALATGIRERSCDLRWNKVSELEFIMPSSSEQQAIVEFLDRKCAEVDEMIGLQEQIIEELKAYKQSVITEAVTKGLNPDVPMKDSGSLWIGEIPTNWNLTRIGDVGEYKKGPFGSAITLDMFVPKGEHTIKVYEQQNAIKKDWTLGYYYLPVDYFESCLKGFEVLPDDIIVSCAGTIGEVYQLPMDVERGIINQALMRMRINSTINLSYFLYIFDLILKREAERSSNGTAIKNIPPFSIFKKILVPLPSLEEQQEIAEYLDVKCTEIDNLISIKQSKIDSLKEYKKSIIYEYVTGKREVE